MWAESAGLGQGSRFCFTIRASSCEAPQLPRAASSSAASPCSSGRRLLVVDDNATNRRLLWRCRPRSGAWCRRTAPVAPRALALLQGGAGPSTWRGARHAHAGDGRRGTGAGPAAPAPQPAAACCSARWAGAKLGAAAELFAAYLHKPLRQSQLFDTLANLLGEGAGRSASAMPIGSKPRMDAGLAAAPPAAHPAGRGQRGEPEAGAAPAAADGLPRRPGEQRHRGHRVHWSGSPTTWC